MFGEADDACATAQMGEHAAAQGAEALAINRHDLLACSVMGIVQIGCGLVALTAQGY